jgi:hypothetical protein
VAESAVQRGRRTGRSRVRFCVTSVRGKKCKITPLVKCRRTRGSTTQREVLDGVRRTDRVLTISRLFRRSLVKETFFTTAARIRKEEPQGSPPSFALFSITIHTPIGRKRSRLWVSFWKILCLPPLLNNQAAGGKDGPPPTGRRRTRSL